MYTNTFAKLISNIFPVLAGILIIKLLSVKDFGAFSLFLSFLSLFGGLSFGINHIYQRYVAVYADDKSDINRVAKLTIITFVARLGIFILILGFLAVIKHFGIIDTSRFSFPYFNLTTIICAIVICKFILKEGLLAAYIDHKFFNLFDSSISILKFLFIFIVMPRSIIIFMLIWLVLEVLRAIVFLLRFMYLLKLNKAKRHPVQNKALEYVRYFKYGRYFFLANIASLIIAFDIDNYFLSFYQNNEIVGLYSFATKIAFVIVGFAPANLLFNIITPIMVKNYEKSKDKTKILNIVTIIFKLNIFLYSVFAIIFCLNIYYIVHTVFADRYIVAIPYIYALIAISFLPVLKNTFEPVARSIEKSSVYIITLVAALVNIAGNFVLIPRLGMAGAIVSTGLAIMIQSITFVLFSVSEIKFKIDMKFVQKLFMNTGLIIAIGILLHKYIDTFTGFLFINITLIGITVIVFKINRCFSKKEANYINSFLPKNIFIF